MTRERLAKLGFVDNISSLSQNEAEILCYISKEIDEEQAAKSKHDSKVASKRKG